MNQRLQDLSVVVVGRNPDSGAKALEELGPNARLITGDATQAATAETAVALAVADFGKLDGLHHVAGGTDDEILGFIKHKQLLDGGLTVSKGGPKA